MKISIRLRIALLTAVVLTTCCIVLSFATGLSVNKMFKEIETHEHINNETENGKPYAMLREFDTQRKNNDERILLALIGTVIFGSVSSYFVAGLAMRPIKDLSNKMREISEENLSMQIETPLVKDEIYYLVHSFNTLLSSLDTSFQREKLFSANVAHELRTPLAVLQSKYELLELKKSDNVNDYKKAIDVSKKNVESLIKITSTLLMLHTAPENFKKADFSLSELLFDVKEELLNSVVEKQIEVTLPDENIIIDADKDLVRIAMLNLIENAIKYNEFGGKIDVLTTSSEEQINILVRDTGIGIPKESLENLFDAFYRVEKSRSRKSGGAGLGLAIVMQIAKLHNGSVSVKSSEGSGSEFLLILKQY